MSILVVCREIPPVGGGAGHVAIHLAQEIARGGEHVHIVTMHFGDLPEYEERPGITLHRVRCGRRNQDSSYLLEMGRFVLGARGLARRIVETEDCRVVHAHALIPDGLIALHAVRSRGVPVVATAHGSDVPGYNPDKFKLAHRLMGSVWHHALRRLDAVVAPSNHLAQLIRAQRPEQAVEVIPNGIALETFQPRPRGDAFLIVSRLVRRKNYHLFLDALALVDEPQTVHIVGIGPALEELQARARKLTQHEIVFHGWLSNGSEDWRALYETSRYFVFPSSSENFPINLLEAQLAGLTVLASDIPGNREVLGDSAIYFDQLNAESIAATLQRLLRGEIPGAAEIGPHGQQRVRDRFSWEAVAERYRTVYENVRRCRAGAVSRAC